MLNYYQIIEECLAVETLSFEVGKMTVDTSSLPASSFVLVRELSKGDYFVLKPMHEATPRDSQVWVRGAWDASLRKYECHRFSDVCDVRYFSSWKIVFLDFVF